MIAILFTLMSCRMPNRSEQDEIIHNEQIDSAKESIGILDSSDEHTYSSGMKITDFESYSEFIEMIPNFESYYQLVFNFSTLSGGISSVPTDNVLAMYGELKTKYDFINIVSQRPLYYTSLHEGDTRFVYDYDKY